MYVERVCFVCVAFDLNSVKKFTLLMNFLVFVLCHSIRKKRDINSNNSNGRKDDEIQSTKSERVAWRINIVKHPPMNQIQRHHVKMQQICSKMYLCVPCAMYILSFVRVMCIVLVLFLFFVCNCYCLP